MKVYIDNELVVPERWRTAWNPNSYKFAVNLEAGKRVPLKLSLIHIQMCIRDSIIGDLKEAFEKQGLIFGLSSHKDENAWFYNGGMKFASDVRDATNTLYGRRYDDEVYTCLLYTSRCV